MLALLCFSNCTTVREISTANSRKEDCSNFVCCPVTLVLLKGDTIHGRFTWSLGNLYQVHENNDSNINRTGNENTAKDAWYPVSTWYKRFTPEEINRYTVNGNTMETVTLVTDKNGTAGPWSNNNIVYLQRSGPDSSQFRLYVSFTARSHGDAQSGSFGLADVLADIAWDMISPGYYTYYIHFPGDTARKVWPANQSPAGFAAKRKMADLLNTCPELQSVAKQIYESPRSKDLIHAMLSKEELKYPKTIPSLLAIFKKYDDWFYR